MGFRTSKRWGARFARGRRVLRDLPLLKKLNLAYGTIIVVSIISLVVVSNTLVARSALEREMNLSRQNVSIVAQGITSLASHIIDISKITVADLQVQEIVSSYEMMNSSERFVAQRLLGTVLDGIIEPRSVVTSMVVYGRNGPISASAAVRLTDVPDFPNVFGFGDDRFGDNRRDPASFPQLPYRDTSRIPYHVEGEPEWCVSLWRRIVDTDNGRVIGVVEVNVSVLRIAELFAGAGAGTDETDEIFIVNGAGVIVIHPDESRINGNIGDEYFPRGIPASDGASSIDRTRNRIVTYMSMPWIDWYILRSQSTDVVLRNIRALTWSLFFTGLASLLFGLFASISFSRTISQPIIDLSRLMESAGDGDLEVRSVHHSGDEVGNLMNSFNRMVERIDGLIRDVSEAEKKRRTYEIAALQEQINPHFLYNTLESVCALARADRNRDVYSMVKSLSRFYRMTLNDGRNIVTIREELDLVEYYLNIQKVRYADTIRFEIDVPDAVARNRIVKLTLQPIVENAIYHGLKHKRRLGTITIRGSLDGDCAAITVTDDGAGIPQEKIETLLRSDDFGEKGFGLWSVHERLKLQFGDPYGIDIESETDRGTTVTVRVPRIPDGDEDVAGGES